MADPRTLTNPPIQEAVMALELSGGQVSTDVLESIAKSLQQNGWSRNHLNHFSVIVGASESVQVQAPHAVGYVVQSADSKTTFQLREGQIAVSHVAPYRGWEALKADANRALEAYVSLTRATAISSISVRYVNRLATAASGLEAIAEILVLPPMHPAGLEGGYVSDFLTKKVIKDIRGDIVANLTVGTIVAVPERPQHDLLLDIDVSRKCNLAPNIDAAESNFNEIRAVKNILFFGAVTNAAMEKYV